MIEVLNSKLTGRLGKLIPRLASDHDNEIVATVRAIQAALRADGLDLHDLAASLTAAPFVKAAHAPQISPAPTWSSLPLSEARSWMRLIRDHAETTDLQRQQLEDMANRLRIGMHFTPHWRRVRLFDEIVARHYAKGVRV